MPWIVLSSSRFLGPPCELIECSTCRDYRRHVLVGQRPDVCPFCARGGRYGAGLADVSPADASPAVVDARLDVPEGACAAGVARVG